MVFDDPHAHPGVARQLVADGIEENVWPVVPDGGARSALAVSADGLTLYTPSDTHRWPWSKITSVSAYRFQVVVTREGHPEDRLATLGQDSRRIAAAVTAVGGVRVSGSAAVEGEVAPPSPEERRPLATVKQERLRARTEALRERAAAEAASSALGTAWWCLGGGALAQLLGIIILTTSGRSADWNDGPSGEAMVFAFLLMAGGGAAVLVAVVAFGVLLGMRMARD